LLERRWRCGLCGFACALQRRSSTLHHRGGGQGLLRRKVLVQAGLGDADFGRHLVDRHQVEALFGQQAVDG
jgi:hypothetical protein